MENLSAADVAAVTRNGGYGYANDGFGFGGGSGIWLFAILALMWGGNGFFGNRGNFTGERCATVEDLANQSNFSRLEGQLTANSQAIASTSSNISNGLCSLGYEVAQQFGNTNNRLSECCCGINRNIDAVRYENALNTAAINANTTAGIQKVLDKMCQDNQANLISRINQLELKEATCGMVKWPQSATYAIGTPFNFSGGYGYGYGLGFNGCNNI